MWLSRVTVIAAALIAQFASGLSTARPATETRPTASQQGHSLEPLLDLLPGFRLRVFRPPADFHDTTARLLSSDGSWIVYDHEHDVPEGAPPISLRLLNGRGRFAHDLTFGRFNRCGSVEWSSRPDRLLFLTNGREGHEVHGNSMEVWLADVRTGSFRRPKLPWLPPNQVPVMSPSGREYLVIRETAGSRSRLVYVVNARTGQRRVLTQGDQAAWSPNGCQVLVTRTFASSKGDSADFYVIGADGRGCKPVILDHQLRDLAATKGWKKLNTNPRPAWIGSGEAILIGAEVPEGSMRTLVCLAPVHVGKPRLAGDATLYGGSRDGQHLLVGGTAHGSMPDYWMMEKSK